MSNPIDRLLDTGVRRLQERSQPPAQGRDGAGAAAEAGNKAPSSTTLDLTGQARQLKALEKEMASTPEFDAGRVNELRQSLSDGSYKVDAQRIADKLLAMESVLL
jgi:negative regulator of flagellin synthesis FlgM